VGAFVSEFSGGHGRASGAEYSIDRIDREGDYAPRNCRRATAAEQRRNSRDVIVVEVALYQLARMLGLDPAVVRNRYRKQGWSLERVLGGSPRRPTFANPVANGRVAP